MGYGVSLSLTTSIAVIGVVWEDDKQNKIIQIETIIGIGMIIGPIVCTYVYGFAGYQLSFYIWAIYTLFASWLC